MDASKIFTEFEKHLTEDERPSAYFNTLADKNDFPDGYPFALLTRMKDIPQSPVHHPEGNVWNHTMLVVDNAAERRLLSRYPRALMWAALLHDLGKITNTKTRNGRITAYEHDVAGEIMTRDFLKACTGDEKLINSVSALVRWHMQLLYVTKHLPFADLKSMVKETDASEVALLCFCDRLGRGDLTQRLIDEELKNIEYFLRKCERYGKAADVRLSSGIHTLL
jgi:tRNA nucleotidyltransferase (CCA-adding enzyme)